MPVASSAPRKRRYKVSAILAKVFYYPGLDRYRQTDVRRHWPARPTAFTF